MCKHFSVTSPFSDIAFRKQKSIKNAHHRFVNSRLYYYILQKLNFILQIHNINPLSYLMGMLLTQLSYCVWLYGTNFFSGGSFLKVLEKKLHCSFVLSIMDLLLGIWNIKVHTYNFLLRFTKSRAQKRNVINWATVSFCTF
jgi:hypothetical protein